MIFNFPKMRPLDKEMVFVGGVHIEVQFLGRGSNARVMDSGSEFDGKSFFGSTPEVAVCCLVGEIEREVLMREKVLM